MTLNGHACIDGAMFALIMTLLTCYNYSYVLSTINWLTLDTVVTLLLFISRSVFIYLFIYLFIYCTVPIFIYLFSYRRVPISYLIIADRMEQHLEVTWTIGSGVSLPFWAFDQKDRRRA